jgi:hypothetical protein
VALPLTVLALSLARWRPRVVSAAVLLLTLVWNITPLAAGLLRSDGAAQAAYWGPAVGFLEAHLTPSYRVEVVDSAHHWGAVYLPRAGIPLARGWYRQDDFPQNAPLYEKLTARKYLDWLRSLGVRYVVLTNSVPDYSAHREAALVRSGRSGLRPVFRNGDVTILSVPSPRRLVSGPAPARVLSFQQTRFSLRLGGAGSYGVAVRYSPYWQPSAGCIARSKTGMIRLTVPRAGVVSLAFAVSAERALDVLTSHTYASCRGH